MNWWRAYHGLPFDSKLAVIAKRCDVRRGDVAAIWVAVLDFASQQEDRGSIVGIDAEEIAVSLDYEAEHVSRVLMTFEEKGMIAAGRVAAWERRQPVRDRPDDSRSRVRAYRHRQRERANADETDETVDETFHETHETRRSVSTERVRGFRKRQKEKMLQHETQAAFHVTPSNALEQSRADKRREEKELASLRVSETQKNQEHKTDSTEWSTDTLLIAKSLEQHANAIGTDVTPQICERIIAAAGGNARAVAAFIGKRILRTFDPSTAANKRRPWPQSLGYWVTVVQEDFERETYPTSGPLRELSPVPRAPDPARSKDGLTRLADSPVLGALRDYLGVNRAL